MFCTYKCRKFDYNSIKCSRRGAAKETKNVCEMNMKSNQRVIPLIFIVLLTATFVLGCSILKSDKKLQNKNKVIELEVTDEEDEEYTRETSEQFFVQNQDGYVYYEDGDIIRTLYERKYAKLYSDYHSFKIAVLNNDVNPPFPKGMSRDGIVFDTEERFLVDSLVMSDFKKFSLDNFIEKYCYVDEHNRLKFHDNYPDTQCTVAYCLWLTGKYVFYKGGFAGGVYIIETPTLNALYNLNQGSSK